MEGAFQTATSLTQQQTPQFEEMRQDYQETVNRVSAMQATHDKQINDLWLASANQAASLHTKINILPPGYPPVVRLAQFS